MVFVGGVARVAPSLVGVERRFEPPPTTTIPAPPPPPAAVKKRKPVPQSFLPDTPITRQTNSVWRRERRSVDTSTQLSK